MEPDIPTTPPPYFTSAILATPFCGILEKKFHYWALKITK
jgi:hypothetical protein